MPTYYDLNELNLPAGEYKITAKATAPGYKASPPSDPYVLYIVEETDEPDMIIGDIHVSGDNFGGGTLSASDDSFVFDGYDDEGNAFLYCSNLGLGISITGISDLTQFAFPLQLKAGQKITVYPFSYGVDTANFSKYEVVIPHETDSPLPCGTVSMYSDTYSTGNTPYVLWSETNIVWHYAEHYPLKIEMHSDRTVIGRRADITSYQSVASVRYGQGVTISVRKR